MSLRVTWQSRDECTVRGIPTLVGMTKGMVLFDYYGLFEIFCFFTFE